ncbi:hypothetical protein V7112_23760, partial [Bacillus sp. JJ1566]|uniref:hypothetical protein n=1 Tax=Bacillus sp. JJ1566 TaxID=3122961 RepID=UPI00300006F8
KISSFKKIIFIIIIPIIGLIVLFGNIINVDGYMSMSSYIFDMIDDFIYRISLLDNKDILFGIGLISKSVTDSIILPYPKSVIDLLLVDQWIMVALYQMGIIGFVLMLFTLIFSFRSVYTLYQNKKIESFKIEILCAGIIIAGFFGFAHGAFIIERLFSTILFIGFSIILSHLVKFVKI